MNILLVKNNNLNTIPTNFKGSIKKNDIWKATLAYATESKETNSHKLEGLVCGFYEYVLYKTPKNDVFELKKSEINDDVVDLLYNGKKITQAFIYNGESCIGKAGICCIENFPLIYYWMNMKSNLMKILNMGR